MVELLVRLAISSCLIGASQVTALPFAWAWKLAALSAAWAFVNWRLDARGVANRGIRGFAAVFDSLLIAFSLALAGVNSEFGFVALLPCLIAVSRFDSPLASMAPLCVATLVGADAITSQAGIPSTMVLGQAAGMLLVSLLFSKRAVRVIIAEPLTATEPELQPDEDLLQVRETYRALRDAYLNLERRSVQDSVVAKLYRCVDSRAQLGNSICEVVQEKGKAQDAAVLVWQGSRLETLGKSAHFPFDPAQDLEPPEHLRATTRTIPLSHEGRRMGMLVLTVDAEHLAADALRCCQTISASIAEALNLHRHRMAAQSRLEQLALLYDLSTADTADQDLCERAAASIVAISSATYVRIVMENAIFAESGDAESGDAFISAVSFAEGPGVDGWIAMGAPGIDVADASSDLRCENLIGSFALTAIRKRGEVCGYIYAYSTSEGNFGCLELIASELGQASSRSDGARSNGLMSGAEFAQAISGGDGCLVYLEPALSKRLLDRHGKAACDRAVRAFAQRLTSSIPQNGALCLRGEMDLIAFLPCGEDQARAWASEASAIASLISVARSDQPPSPLPVRARIASLSPQKERISVEQAS
jgi:uncharacterized protein YlxP (DUF503 family)